MSQEETHQATNMAPRTQIRDLPRIEDLPASLEVLSEAEAALVTGGRIRGSCEPACCTVNNDTDYLRD